MAREAPANSARAGTKRLREEVEAGETREAPANSARALTEPPSKKLCPTNPERAYLSATRFRKEAWFHRDEKTYVASRDGPHLKKHADAFAYPDSYQSALNFTYCGKQQASFVFLLASHLEPDQPSYRTADDAHRVMVPYQEVQKKTICKAEVKEGEMIIWKSSLIHAGGFETLQETREKESDIEVCMWRVVKNKEDTNGIRETLDTVGACIIPILSPEEIRNFLQEFTCDLNAIFQPKEPFQTWTDAPKAGSGRGGSAIPPITLGKFAWDAKLHPERVALFQRLLQDPNLCVGLDSVHWSPEHGRVAVMASFAPVLQRGDEAFKRKCVAAAFGRWRTTHWSQFGDLSSFCYGDRFRRSQHFANVSPTWTAHALNGESEIWKTRVYPVLQQKRVGELPKAIQEIAARLTVEEAKELVRDSLVAFL